MKRYLLHSGGLDSHVAWLMDPTRVPVYVRHSSRNELREVLALGALADHDPNFTPMFVRCPEIGMDAAFDGHVRHRNLLLLAMVAQLHDCDEVAYGAVRGEASADKSPQFVRAFDRALRISEGTRLVAPIAHLTKGQAVAELVWSTPSVDRMRVIEALELTRSCYSADSGECGVCQACYRRALAFWQAGIVPDPPASLPTETDGAWANLRRTPLRRWPDLVRANVPAVRAWLASRR